MRVKVALSFERALRQLPPDRSRRAAQAITKFMREPALPSLRFRPLAGAPGYFIINPHGGDRIILRKETEDLFTAVDVGPHDNIYRRWNR